MAGEPCRGAALAVSDRDDAVGGTILLPPWGGTSHSHLQLNIFLTFPKLYFEFGQLPCPGWIQRPPSTFWTAGSISRSHTCSWCWARLFSWALKTLDMDLGKTGKATGLSKSLRKWERSGRNAQGEERIYQKLDVISSPGWGFPGGAYGKESACQCGKQKRRGLDPWVGKVPWRSAWQPTPVFLPGEPHGQRSLAGYSPQGCKRIRHGWAHRPHLRAAKALWNWIWGSILPPVSRLWTSSRFSFRTLSVSQWLTSCFPSVSAGHLFISSPMFPPKMDLLLQTDALPPAAEERIQDQGCACPLGTVLE